VKGAPTFVLPFPSDESKFNDDSEE